MLITAGLAGLSCSLFAGTFYRMQGLENRIVLLEAAQDERDEELQKTRAMAFRASNAFKGAQIDTKLSTDDILTSKKGTKAVIFTKSDCPHCQHLESVLYENQDLLTEQVYFYNTDDLSGSIQKDTTGKEMLAYYEENKDEFTLRGSPTMVVMREGSDQLQCYMGAVNIVGGLTELAKGG